MEPISVVTQKVKKGASHNYTQLCSISRYRCAWVNIHCNWQADDVVWLLFHSILPFKKWITNRKLCYLEKRNDLYSSLYFSVFFINNIGMLTVHRHAMKMSSSFFLEEFPESNCATAYKLLLSAKLGTIFNNWVQLQLFYFIVTSESEYFYESLWEILEMCPLFI